MTQENVRPWLIARKRALCNRQGLTLVEVAIASLILLVVTFGILRADLTSRFIVHASRVDLEVLSILQSYLEDERSQSYVNVADAAYPAVTFSSRGTADASDDITGSVTIDVTDNGDDTKTISATAAWDQHRLNQRIAKTMTLQTMVSEP